MPDVVLCADDYGYRPGVDAAIIALASAGRLSATSVMVGRPGWAASAERLSELSRHIDVGLHVNLVEGAPLGPMPRLAPAGQLPPIGDLVRLALTGGIDLAEVRAEVRRQIEAFIAATGQAPAFIDGHQHAHALPAVGAAVLGAVADVLPGVSLPMRDPSDRFRRIAGRKVAVPKALAISALTHGFARLARKRWHTVNDGFAGVYDFSGDSDLAAYFERFLSMPGTRHLVMCHPGYAEAGATADPIAAARAREADYLASADFGGLLARLDVRLARFSTVAVASGAPGGA